MGALGGRRWEVGGKASNSKARFTQRHVRHGKRQSRPEMVIVSHDETHHGTEKGSWLANTAMAIPKASDMPLTNEGTTPTLP